MSPKIRSKLYLAGTISTLLLTSCGGSQPAPTAPSKESGSAPQFQVASTFANSMVAQETFALEAVRRAYRGILQREGDEGGILSYAASVSRDGMKGWLGLLESLLESEEFKSNIAPQQSNRDLLESYYAAFLERGLDTGGARDYLDLMARGQQLEVLWTIATSDEFMGKVHAHTRFNENTFESAARKVHFALLGRDASAAESTQYRRSAWRGLHGLHIILEELLQHDELTAEREAAITRRTIFQALLGRDANNGEAPKVLAAVRAKDFYSAIFALLVWPEFYERL